MFYDTLQNVWISDDLVIRVNDTLLTVWMTHRGPLRLFNMSLDHSFPNQTESSTGLIYEVLQFLVITNFLSDSFGQNIMFLNYFEGRLDNSFFSRYYICFNLDFFNILYVTVFYKSCDLK